MLEPILMRDKINIVDKYIQELTGPIGEEFERIENQLKKDNKFGINIGVTEGVMLAFFVKALGVRSILEIGTQYGYSTLWLLKNLPPDGSLITLEKDEQHFAQAQSHIQDSRCTLMQGDAKLILSEKLHDQTFDLIFIDANKKSYPDYLRYAKEHIHIGGVIVGDNTFLMNSIFGQPTERRVDPSLTEAMRAFNTEMFSDPRFTSCIVPTTEGLTIAFRNS